MQGPAESWQDYTLFGFLVGGVLVAVLAELRKLKTPLDFGVLLRVVVHFFAFSALEFYQCFLGHKILWSRRPELNWRPAVYKTAALTS